VRSRLQFRLAIALCTALAAPTAGLRGQEIQPAKDAIGRLKLLPGSVQQVITVIKGTNFGPFKTAGRCTYDNHWYCFGDCRWFAWTWEFPQYSWLKTDLEGRYNRVRDHSAQFDAAFSPVKTWLIVSLPQISKQVDLANVHVQSGKLAEVKAAVAQLEGQLTASSGQLDGSLRNLAIFNQTMNSLLQQANSRDAMEGMIRRDADHLNNRVASFPCGADDCRNQYNNVANTVRGQFDKIAQASQGFGLSSAQTDKDISLILGPLLTTQGSIATVHKNLQNATVIPAAVIQQLRLKVVAAQWQELSEYARLQLGN
jgi:hypothetical protein